MYWNETAENTPNHTDVHLLMNIDMLLRKRGIARVGDIARQLALPCGDVRFRLAGLQKRKLVVSPSKHSYALSSDGIALVNAVLGARRILQQFFENVLHVPRTIALTDACKMKHLLSAESAARLVIFMGHYLVDSERVVGFRRVLDDYVGRQRL